MRTIAGLATARGFVSGPVFIYRGSGDVSVSEYLIEPGREGDELLRFKRAQFATRRDLEHLISALKERTSRDDVRVFECHLMILEDPLLCDEIEKYIVEKHLNAEAAVRRTTDNARMQFERMNDPYFKERVRDLDDVERRLLKWMTGSSGDPLLELRTPSIIVAEDLTPSETVQMPRECVLGFATNGGSTTSHVALLARALGIPCVTGLGDITSSVKAGDTVLLDGTNGAITINPDEHTCKQFEELVRRQNFNIAVAVSGAPAGTLKDGSEIRIYANIHPGVPVAGLKELGARGIGLYRSEYLWLNRELEPTEEEQFEAYSSAVKFVTTLGEDATITIRMLDIGGDKTVRGISAKEANPFLGNRSIRYLLSNREVLRTQLKAVLRASGLGVGHVYLMYPMVSCVEELKEAATVMAEVKRQLDAEGIPYDKNIPVGAMIEVPAAAINADALAKHVNFFSIGTNDLIQYTMAADRANDAVAHLYQPTNLAVLKLMEMTIDAAKRNGIPVAVCGESAADPVVGILWAAMGIRMLSMSATYMPVMTKLMSQLTQDDLNDYLAMVKSMPMDSTASEIYDACYKWMSSKIPDLESLLI